MKNSNTKQVRRDKLFMRQMIAFRQAIQVAGSMTICAGTTRGYYSGADLSAPATRPGADDHKALPSRYMDQLIYAGGVK
jgi:hypothetical protein